MPNSPDPTSRNIHARGNREFQEAAKTRGRSPDQAPLHAEGGRETPPARDPQGSTPFVVRVGLEAARSAATRSSKESGVEIDRDAFYDCFGIYPDDLRLSFATALEFAVRAERERPGDYLSSVRDI
jgi:hypothetical protein